MKLPCSPAVNLGCRNLISQSVTPIDQTAEAATRLFREAPAQTRSGIQSTPRDSQVTRRPNFDPILCGVATPPVLARGGQGVNRIVILVEAGESAGVVGFDAGLVILRPVRDALLAVVFLQLLHPAFADKRDV